MEAPKAKKIEHKVEQHSDVRIDNYAWLKDKNWKQFIDGDLNFFDKEVKEYIDAENDYKDSQLEDYKDVKENLYQEILSRVNEDTKSHPVEKGDHLYYYREEKGRDYPLYCRSLKTDTTEEIYLDINKEAEGHDLFSFRGSMLSPNTKYLGYEFNLSGSMEASLKIRNMETKIDLDWTITDLTGEFLWVSNDEIYIAERDEFSRGKHIYKVNIHEGPESKKLVFTKPAEYGDMFLGLSETNDQKYQIISLMSGSTQVVYISKNGSDNFKFFSKMENDTSVEIEHHKDRFFILTNTDKFSDFKIMTCPVKEDSWSENCWEVFLDVREGQCLDSFEIYNDNIVIEKKNNKKALSEIEVLNINSKKIYTVDIGDEVYCLESEGAWDCNSKKIRLSIETPIYPEKIVELNLLSGKLIEVYQKETPNFDSSKYELKREYAKAKDGELIPLTVVHLKNIEKNGNNKAFVYGYGSYGMGMPAYFSSSIFSLIDRGFIYCISHIRGGDDKGHKWYLSGKMHQKMNTFTDFIDSCEHLVNQKYTSSGDITINGGSAGGLLMGTVTNLRPDLFKSVVADVAFVDLINTISDSSLPLTPPEWEEWGNPIESVEDYKYMMSYSPYDNIEKKEYPAMMYNSGISDEQVTYWEPTKMVAKLREFKTDNNLLILNMKMHAGHAGASKRYEDIDDKALVYSFILKTHGVK